MKAEREASRPCPSQKMLTFTIVLVLFSSSQSSSATNESFPRPCREWLNPCLGGEWLCTSEESYQRYLHGPQFRCPVRENSTIASSPAPGQCRLINNTCQYTNSTLQCSVWIPDCDYRYTCGSVEERERARENTNCGVIGHPPPPPDNLCLPINNTCQWYNPCHYWRGHCLSPYQCGTADEYYNFVFGPIPGCFVPPERWVELIPPGECLIYDQECNWSNCTAYLDWCRSYWMCGSQYDRAVYQSSPPPPCPPPPPDYTTPLPPGVCRFNITIGQCQFQTATQTTPPATSPVTPSATTPICANGTTYSTCGSACPLTCENRDSPPIFCPQVCVSGCFCPSGMAAYQDACYLPSDCPTTGPASGRTSKNMATIVGVSVGVCWFLGVISAVVLLLICSYGYKTFKQKRPYSDKPDNFKYSEITNSMKVPDIESTSDLPDGLSELPDDIEVNKYPDDIVIGSKRLSESRDNDTRI